jgi:hypothetical protein
MALKTPTADHNQSKRLAQPKKLFQSGLSTVLKAKS